MARSWSFFRTALIHGGLLRKRGVELHPCTATWQHHFMLHWLILISQDFHLHAFRTRPAPIVQTWKSTSPRSQYVAETLSVIGNLIWHDTDYLMRLIISIRNFLTTIISHREYRALSRVPRIRRNTGYRLIGRIEGVMHSATNVWMRIRSEMHSAYWSVGKSAQRCATRRISRRRITPGRTTPTLYLLSLCVLQNTIKCSFLQPPTIYSSNHSTTLVT